MDPNLIPTLAAIISAIAGGAAGEAGKQAWTSLTRLVRRRFGDHAPAALEHPGAQPDEITRILVDHAKTDADFEQALTAWTTNTLHLIQHDKVVRNTISGDAHISGSVVQAGDIGGSIQFGTPHRPAR